MKLLFSIFWRKYGLMQKKQKAKRCKCKLPEVGLLTDIVLFSHHTPSGHTPSCCSPSCCTSSSCTSSCRTPSTVDLFTSFHRILMFN